MELYIWAGAASLAVIGGLARLWWLLRERTYRRREQARRRWWAAYRLRLPLILMARWSRNRALTYRSDTAS
ncbi:hypothetical protein [uncultured Sphingomonas sp.]|uniref:hypothetical protein n=1 Tax=uncultured Sphingomonas sp. TaxID=158754 RepID=UPI0035CB0EAC